MRIISGSLKGKSLTFIKSLSTRPLKDSVKENMFNIIAHSNLLDASIEKANILDLYSGIGSFGLECLSRGAEETTFVERDKEIGKILSKNILNLSLKDKSTVINGEIINFLNINHKKKFNIIFLDPPFKDKTFIENLRIIKSKKIIKKQHLVIIHREQKSKDNFKNILKILMTKKYGRSKIIFGKF